MKRKTTQKKTAIMSVSDKDGLIGLAQCFQCHGIQIISSGGTYKELQKEIKTDTAGAQIQEVSEYTGFPEMMDGRLKTIHPKVAGGILFVRDNPEHVKSADVAEMSDIRFVVVNFYPFEKTVAKEGATFDEIIEQIDIGGPSMVRAAVKNFKSVTVICDPADYDRVIDEMDCNAGGLSPELRLELAARAMRISMKYETAISTWFDKQPGAFGPKKPIDWKPY